MSDDSVRDQASAGPLRNAEPETIEGAWVLDADGAELGRVVRHDESSIEVALHDARVLLLPPNALEPIDGRVDRLRLLHPVEGELHVPIAAERVRLDKQVVEGERVRVAVSSHDEERTLPAVDLAREELDVERIRQDREIDCVPPIRQEGEVVVVPVVEEVLVVQKALVLREEVRVRRRRVTERRPEQRVTVRVERADIERR